MDALRNWAHGLSGAVQASRWDRDRTVAYQGERLRRLVLHAFRHVPLYRELFQQHGIRPEEIRGLEDLERLPLIDRNQLQTEPVQRRLARGYHSQRLVRRLTSGSSGEPLEILRSVWEERLLASIRVNMLRRYGARLTDRHTSVKFLRDSKSAQLSRQPGAWLRLAGVRLFPRRQIDCLLSDREILDQLSVHPPDILSGGGATISLLATALRDADRERLRPRMIITGGESLLPEMRRQILDGFGVEPRDTFGSHEFNLLAWQCPASGLYHVSDESVLLEVLRDGRPAAPGEAGEVVATALHSFAMPFIRYRLGDLVVLGSERCECGARGPMLQHIFGRSIDFFMMPDGHRLHPYVLVGPLVMEARWVRRFKIVQETLHSIHFKVLPERPPTPGEFEALRQRMQGLLPPDVIAAIEITRDLPRGTAGKYRPYESLVANPMRAGAGT